MNILTGRDLIFAFGGVIITTLGAYLINLSRNAIEKKKIKSDNEKFIQDQTNFIGCKYNLYKKIMENISKLTGPIYNLYSRLLKNKLIPACEIKSFFDPIALNKILDDIASLVRSDQLVVPRSIHIHVTRNYCIEVRKMIEDLKVKLELLYKQDDVSLVVEIRNITNEIIGHNDTTKSFLYEDMNATMEAIRKKL